MTGDLDRYLYHSHQGWPVYETQTPSSLTGEAITHDPLCPYVQTAHQRDHVACQCDLIAKVREENRRERVMLEEVIDHYKAYFNQVEKLGWHTGVRDCIAVVRDALKVHYCCGCSEDERIYVEALRALLEKP